jgi:hypothetical protein
MWLPLTMSKSCSLAHRSSGLSDALLLNVQIRKHPAANIDNFQFDIPAHPREAQQTVIISLPTDATNQTRIQIVPTIAPAAIQQGRFYKFWVMVNGLSQIPSPAPGQLVVPNAPVFEANLHPGQSRIDVQMLAEVPEGEAGAHGSNVQLDVVTVLATISRN